MKAARRLSLRRAWLVGVLLAAGASAAESVQGGGRVSIGPGWRLTPNDHFYARAREAGFEPGGASAGGPVVTGAFGYSATENLEVCIDLLLGYESVRLVDLAPIASFTYGALIMVRVQRPDLPSEGWTPYVGAGLGPLLVNVSSASLGANEQLVTGAAAVAGLTVHLTPSLGLSAEYRLLYGRGLVPDIGGINGGGSWFTVGLTVYFPPEPSGAP